MSIPDKVEECVSGTDPLHLGLAAELLLGPFPRMDDEHHDDADDHGDDGGCGVVHHRPKAHPSRRTAVQGSHACNRPASWKNQPVVILV